MARVIVVAGHENIRNITAERIGSTSATKLRGSTGALGLEAELFNTPWATALVTRLQQQGIEAVRTAAIFDANAYHADADLIVVGHCDGVRDLDHPQHCMAAAVQSGAPGPTAGAMQRAEAFLALWRDRYPREIGIPGDGPITDNMTHYYGGFYRTRSSPMVLVEHCILGSGGRQRFDIPTPVDAAQVEAEIIADFLGELRGLSLPEECRFFPETQHSVCHGFLAFWQAHGGLEQFGFPLTEERTEVIEGRALTVQYFERARFEFHPELSGTGDEVLLSDLGRQILRLRGEL
jgi:hypothetical protein